MSGHSRAHYSQTSRSTSTVTSVTNTIATDATAGAVTFVTGTSQHDPVLPSTQHVVVITRNRSDVPAVDVTAGDPTGAIPSDADDVQRGCNVGATPLATPAAIARAVSVERTTRDSKIEVPVVSSFYVHRARAPTGAHGTLRQALSTVRCEAVIAVETETTTVSVAGLSYRTDGHASSHGRSTPRTAVAPLHAIRSHDTLSS